MLSPYCTKADSFSVFMVQLSYHFKEKLHEQLLISLISHPLSHCALRILFFKHCLLITTYLLYTSKNLLYTYLLYTLYLLLYTSLLYCKLNKGLFLLFITEAPLPKILHDTYDNLFKKICHHNLHNEH